MNSSDVASRLRWVLGDPDTELIPSPTDLGRLVEGAQAAQLTARPLVSGFKVGAALLTVTSELYLGGNVEASNGSSICAERTALTKAATDGHSSFVAVCAIGDTEAPITPCGQCRQHLADFSSGMLVIMASTRTSELEVARLSDLFPRWNFKLGSSAVASI